MNCHLSNWHKTNPLGQCHTLKYICQQHPSTMNNQKVYYSRAMIEDAAEFLWFNFGIAVDSLEYKWDADKIIEEAAKKGWKFSFY